jgi:peptidoglycan hydrolase-like protein with peptidoglycan-binding domain
LGLVAGAAGVAARLAWPAPRITTSADALVRISVPRFAGRVVRVRVLTRPGAAVPVTLRGGELWPQRRLPQAARLLVEVTVRRPSWAGWVAGATVQEHFQVITPSLHVRSRLLHVRTGAPVAIGFDTAAQVVSLDGTVQRRSRPAPVVQTGVVARGVQVAGSVEVAAAPRPWELLSSPVRVSWFPVGVSRAVVASPAPGTKLAPDQKLTLTFSSPLGGVTPRIQPGASGAWRIVDDHSVAFEPAGLGYPLGGSLRIVLPKTLRAVLPATGKVVTALQWQVASGSTLRLQELLAQLHWLPLRWTGATVGRTPAAQLGAAISAPRGAFAWRYPHVPKELRALWAPGSANLLTRAALMRFEDAHGLPVDGVPGPAVWRALFADTIAGRLNVEGYSYVLVHETVPETLAVWHNGAFVTTSPGNTGIPQAPTATGTYPVFEHIPVGTMSGTNPNDSHYNDPGVRWISYFHGGDAIHAFYRASYGSPQSLGCVELPASAAQEVWPYTPVGTLVTVEA